SLALAAATILHAHDALGAFNLGPFATSDDAAIRTAAFHLAALGVEFPGQLFAAGVSDADHAVRSAALDAAAWTQQPWLRAHCRQAAGMAELRLLASLGEPTDLGLIQDAARDVSLGPQRLELLGLFGHPAGVLTLFREMDHADPRIAVAAGLAFAK